MNGAPALKRHLTDCFSELFAYVMTFRQLVLSQHPAYEEVRTRILQLLKESESFVTSGHSSMEDYDQARYAVCAWIDECVMGSNWNAKSRWRPEMLQRMYYQSADAGEKFFERLKSLPAQQQAIREVYTLCLALGFKGRYCAPDDGYALEQLINRQMKWLFNSVSEAPTPAFLEKNTLFPEAYPKVLASPQQTLKQTSWAWKIAIVGPLALLAALFLTFRLTLSHVGENILKVLS